MYSLRDSIIKPEDLIKRLKEIGQDAVAITDHGSSLGGVSIYKALKSEGIKYLHGVEFYICDDVSIKDKNSKYNHLVALCKDETGRKNLNILISMSEHPDHKYYKPRIDFKTLSRHGDGLIILSACMAGEICRLLEKGETTRAVQTALLYKDRFGGDYYLELQARNDPKQIDLNKQIAAIAYENHIPCVVTCDAHHTWEADRKYQMKYAFNGAYKEDGESYLDCFIQSEEEVRNRLTYLDSNFVDDMIRNTHIIAGKCNVQMPLSPPIMPDIDTPGEYGGSKDWLIALCKEGFQQKLGIDYDNPHLELSQTYIDRFHYELDSLDRMGFLDYILLVYTYANVAKRRGIARGSGGGSLICYLTNITNIDPIEHGLYFERFIDVGALTLLEEGHITANELKIPDIDLDFSSEGCKEVLKFLYNTYGEDKVASIGKFGTNQTKGAIRDMCKVLDIDLQTADQIAKAFDAYEIQDIDLMIDGVLDAPASAKEAMDYVIKYMELFDYVRKLTGLPKSFGLHACGKVISTKDLDSFLPSCYDSEGVRYLQGDMHDVEDVGLVKIDVLGLRTIDQEYDTLEQTGEDETFIDPKQDYTDPKVLEIFKTGDTLGVFQMASYGMRDTLKKMDIQGIEDLSIANALFRPGALAYIDNFCRRRSGKEAFEYLHPDLEGILKNTYGIIVFQEQLIEIGRLAGIRNPDLLRKATGKKNPKLLAEVKPELEEKLKSRGWSQEQFDTLWADMIEFSRYSFNKSHSSAYGIISYMTAKQKAYYPAEFYAGLCNSYIGKSAFVKDEAEEIMQDMLRHKVYLHPFSFRQDHRRCTVKDGRMLYAIPLIKECNIHTAEVLYALKDNIYTHFWRLLSDLTGNQVDQAKINILIRLGFFHEFGNTKQLLRVNEWFQYLKAGQRKSIRKDTLMESPFLYEIISRNATAEGKDGKPLKTFKNIHMEQVLNQCEEAILKSNISEFDYSEIIAVQRAYLGFVALITGREEDRAKLFIKDVIPLFRKKDNKQFGYSVIGRSIGSGIETRYTVFNSVYNKVPLQPDDVVLCRGWQRDGPYFKMTGYKIISREGSYETESRHTEANASSL